MTKSKLICIKRHLYDKLDDIKKEKGWSFSGVIEMLIKGVKELEIIKAGMSTKKEGIRETETERETELLNKIPKEKFPIEEDLEFRKTPKDKSDVEATPDEATVETQDQEAEPINETATQ